MYLQSIDKISKVLNLSSKSVKNTLQLLEDGATIPFIARYRKEATGGLDETQIEQIKNEYKNHVDLEKRKDFILNSIEKQGKLTPELKLRIAGTRNQSELEDLYLPFKTKKKSRASKARELGLEPLAEKIFKQDNSTKIREEVGKFTSNELNYEEALQGARDIIAEWINENAEGRTIVREMYQEHAYIQSKVIKTKIKEAGKFKDYFDTRELLTEIPSHRLLAIRRGESEGFLRVKVEVNSESAIRSLAKHFLKASNECSNQVKIAIEDCYSRLMGKSISNEFAKLSKEKADKEAIKVFGANLRQLLLAPALGQRKIIAIDPGFRTGCKTVVLNEFGDLKESTVIFSDKKDSAEILTKLLDKYSIDTIAIGNGTASRETEKFIRSIRYTKKLNIFVVNEDGASIYSASEIGREEFPTEDITARGAVSIGRRFLDPLAELVKLEPKSIGVGQYQHDVDQTKLEENLNQTVISAVNLVGVDLNTANKYILGYISGLGEKLAENIIAFRNKNGNFKNRKQLLKVNKLGPKAFEQCAGFLRITNGDNILDNSSVHPESYQIVKKICKDLGTDVEKAIGNEEMLDKIDLNRYVSDEIGLPTLTDIIEELKKPARDPRGEVERFEFDESANEIEDLEEGMILPGIVTNITNFGAFVDIGVHCDGLVHISQMSKEFVKDPMDVVNLNDKVKVKVVSIDLERKRIGLSMVGF